MSLVCANIDVECGVMSRRLCGDVIVECIKLLCHQKLQVPHTYEALRYIVETASGAGNDMGAHTRTVSRRHKREMQTLTTALHTLNTIFKNIVLEVESNDPPEEVYIVFGVTPVSAKEVFRIILPDNLQCHYHRNYGNTTRNTLLNIMKKISTSPELTKTIFNPISPTNMYILINKRKVLKSTHGVGRDFSDFFLPVPSLKISPKITQTTIKLTDVRPLNMNFCDQMIIFDDFLNQCSIFNDIDITSEESNSFIYHESNGVVENKTDDDIRNVGNKSPNVILKTDRIIKFKDNLNKCNDGPNKSGDSFNRCNEGPDNRNKSIDNFKKCIDGPDKSSDCLEKCNDNLGKSDDNLNKCNDNLGKSADNLNKCNDNLGKSADNLNKCNDNLGKSDDNLNKCNDNLGKSDDNLNKCNDNLGKSDDNLNKCNDNFGKSDDNLNKCNDKPDKSGDSFNECSDDHNICNDNHSEIVEKHSEVIDKCFKKLDRNNGACNSRNVENDELVLKSREHINMNDECNKNERDSNKDCSNLINNLANVDASQQSLNLMFDNKKIFMKSFGSADTVNAPKSDGEERVWFQACLVLKGFKMMNQINS